MTSRSNTASMRRRRRRGAAFPMATSTLSSTVEYVGRTSAYAMWYGPASMLTCYAPWSAATRVDRVYWSESVRDAFIASPGMNH